MKHIIAGTLFAFAAFADDRTLTVSLVSTFSGLQDVNTTSESCEYNADLDLYYLQDQNFGAGTGEMFSLSSDMSDFGIAIFGTDLVPVASGMAYVDSKLFVLSFATGLLYRFDTTTNSDDNVSVSIGLGAEGLCADPDDATTLFATTTEFTDFGTTSAVFKIDISADPFTVEDVYNQAESDEPFEGESGGFTPNGCTIYNGVVYMVEYVSTDARLVMYDIETGIFTYSEAPWTYGDGVVISNGFIFVTDFNQGLFSLDMTLADAEWVQHSEITLPAGSADMCLGKDGVVVVPSYGAASSLTGDISFISLEIATPDPTVSPTKSPTAVSERLELSVSLSATYYGLQDDGTSSESCEYNSDLDVYYLQNQGSGAGTGEMYSLSSDMSELESAIFGTDLVPFATGMVYLDGKLFVVSFLTGMLYRFDTTTNSLDNVSVVIGGGANGLCADPGDATTLFATTTEFTDFGTQSAVLKIDISADPFTVEDVYNQAESDEPFEGESGGLTPNGCTVYDGVVYIVEFVETDARLVMYDIETGVFTYMDVPWNNADGVVVSRGYLFVTDFNRGLFSWDFDDDSDWVHYSELNLAAGNADMCVGKDDMLLIPSFGVPGDDTGQVYFIDLMLDTPMPTGGPTLPTVSPTMFPTKSPTTEDERLPLAVTVSSVYTGLREDGTTTESCAYNEDLDVYYLQNQGYLEGTGEMYSLSGDLTVLAESILGDWKLAGMTGMEYTNGKLYVVSFATGVLHEIDTDTNTVDGPSVTVAGGANGLCADPDNPTILYMTTTEFTDLGFTSGVYKVDVSTSTFELTTLYSQDDGDTPFEGETGGMTPNGCVVYEGVVYIVEYVVSDARLVMYDIDSGVFSYSEVPWTNADGVVVESGYMFVTDFGRGLFSWDMMDDSEWVYHSELNLAPGSADMCVGKGGVLVIPSFGTPSPLYGDVTFIDVVVTTPSDDDSGVRSQNVWVSLLVCMFLASFISMYK